VVVVVDAAAVGGMLELCEAMVVLCLVFHSSISRAMALATSFLISLWHCSLLASMVLFMSSWHCSCISATALSVLIWHGSSAGDGGESDGRSGDGRVVGCCARVAEGRLGEGGGGSGEDGVVDTTFVVSLCVVPPSVVAVFLAVLGVVEVLLLVEISCLLPVCPILVDLDVLAAMTVVVVVVVVVVVMLGVAATMPVFAEVGVVVMLGERGVVVCALLHVHFGNVVVVVLTGPIKTK